MATIFTYTKKVEAYNRIDHFWEMTIMKTMREEVLGKDLPEQWQTKAKVKPYEVVTVTIQPGTEELTKRLLNIADKVSVEAEQKGLTEEKLNELLNEER